MGIKLNVAVRGKKVLGATEDLLDSTDPDYWGIHGKFEIWMTKMIPDNLAEQIIDVGYPGGLTEEEAWKAILPHLDRKL